MVLTSSTVIFDASSMVPLRSSPIKLPDNLYIAFSYIVHYPDHGERAAYTGLQPTPASRLRGTYPHLLHSCEAFSTCFSWHNLTLPYKRFRIRRFRNLYVFAYKDEITLDTPLSEETRPQ